LDNVGDGQVQVIFPDEGNQIKMVGPQALLDAVKAAITSIHRKLETQQKTMKKVFVLTLEIIYLRYIKHYLSI
jgi:hypothetical protein